MSERVPNVTNKTEVVKDAVTVFCNGLVFEGWEDLQLVRELNAAAGDFQFQMTDKWEQGKEPFRIQPGDAIHIHVGKQSFFQGYCEKMRPSFSAQKRSITVSGRSKTCDLVDCDAQTTADYSGLTIKDIATKLCAPFGIVPVMKTDPAQTVPLLRVNPGDKVFSILDKAGRQIKVLFYPSYDGNLVIANQGEARSTTELKQGINVLSGDSTFDNTNRFSDYSVGGQNLPNLGTALGSIGPIGVAKDLGVTRFRPLVLIAEQAMDDAKGDNRASYEADLRAAKALSVNIQVQGFFQFDGTPWEINRIVRVDCGFLGVRRQLLITKVTFNKNGGGTTTTLELTRSDAFLFPNKVKKEDPLGWTRFVK